jgi:hypothetical protein
MPVRRSTTGVLLAALALAACENLPYYDESLDLFSWSRYDPEVEAIEERTPPPQDSPVIEAPTGDAAMAEPAAAGVLVAAAAERCEAADRIKAGCGTAASRPIGPNQAVFGSNALDRDDLRDRAFAQGRIARTFRTRYNRVPRF